MQGGIREPFKHTLFLFKASHVKQKEQARNRRRGGLGGEIFVHRNLDGEKLSFLLGHLGSGGRRVPAKGKLQDRWGQL